MLAGIELEKYASGHQMSNQLNEKNNNLPEHKLDNLGETVGNLQHPSCLFLHCILSM